MNKEFNEIVLIKVYKYSPEYIKEKNHKYYEKYRESILEKRRNKTNMEPKKEIKYKYQEIIIKEKNI